jgi:hypothetical protein
MSMSPLLLRTTISVVAEVYPNFAFAAKNGRKRGSSSRLPGIGVTFRGAVSAFAVIFSVSNTCGLTPTMSVVGVSEWIDHTPNGESEQLYLSLSFSAIGAQYGVEPAR